MPCTYSYLQDNFYNRIDGAVSKTVALKEFALEEFDNKVEGSSPSKTFFFFFFFFLLSQICRKFFEIYMFTDKACFDVICTC